MNLIIQVAIQQPCQYDRWVGSVKCEETCTFFESIAARATSVPHAVPQSVNEVMDIYDGKLHVNNSTMRV
jgi:hypothetical protein